MELADCGKPEEAPETKEHEDKSNNITIDISLIMGKMGGKPHAGGEEEEITCEEEDKDLSCLKGLEDCDDDSVDWKSVAKQLLQAVSMMDTHTDGVNSGTEEPEHAIKAIDNETSRVLWGKQDDSNPRSSYQNANYGETTANGLVMTNPAELCNEEAYGSSKAEKPASAPKAKQSKADIPFTKDHDDDDDNDDAFDDKNDPDDKYDLDDKYDTPDEPDDFPGGKFPGKRFPPKKPQGFKKAAEGIINKGQKKSREEKPQDNSKPNNEEPNNKEDEVGQHAR